MTSLIIMIEDYGLNSYCTVALLCVLVHIVIKTVPESY